MNGVNGTGPSPGLWQEARTPEGKLYYYHSQTKATSWTKPVESTAERALAAQPWKEAAAPNGRKYWYNADTKATTWDMPEVYKNVLDAGEPQTPSVPQFVAGGGSAFQSHAQRDREEHGERLGTDRQIGFGQNDAPSSRGPAFLKSTDPEYNSYEEAETAFMKLLKRLNVQPDWTWEQTMKATIKDPQYRSIKDPRDRKAAFEKYVVEVRAQERDKEKERLAKLRADFGLMLRTHLEIKHYTRWKTAKPILERETIFRSTNDDDERRQLFEEYIIELKKTHVEKEAKTRKSAMDELVNILKALDLEPYTRWSEAHTTIESNERFASDDKFKTLSKSDVLTAFENHIKSLERTFNDERQREKNTKARRERKARDDFIDLLKQLKSAGKIKAGTKWMQVLPDFENDPRYTAILGQPGSTPLDLFWDTVEEEERALRVLRNEVYDVLEDKRYEITLKTPLSEFLSIMATDSRTASIPEDAIRLIFNRLLEKIAKRNEEDKHASERQQRRAIDALRSRIKHLDKPPIRSDSTWEAIRPQIIHLDEFKALEDDDLRKQAFDKVMRRLKEKDEDVDRRREHRDRERDREKGSRKGARGSRTPEPDAYEADRRKAMADRERQYHKASGTGLSPPPRERERDRRDRQFSRHDEGRLVEFGRERDRDRDRDRHGRDRVRDRDDEERERLYRLRGDPRAGRDELDYGGGASSGSQRRRRADSDGDSAESRKRIKREKREEEKKEEVAMHSGSEEGEMVED